MDLWGALPTADSGFNGGDEALHWTINFFGFHLQEQPNPTEVTIGPPINGWFCLISNCVKKCSYHDKEIKELLHVE